MCPAGIVSPYAMELIAYRLVQLGRHSLFGPRYAAEPVMLHCNLENVRIHRDDLSLQRQLEPRKKKYPSFTYPDLVEAHEQDAVCNFPPDAHQLQQLFPSVGGAYTAEATKPLFRAIVPFCRYAVYVHEHLRGLLDKVGTVAEAKRAECGGNIRR
jgi:hypothetical protein